MMVAFAGHLVSTNVEDRRAAYINHTILRGVPLQAFKSVVVVWQILTQVSNTIGILFWKGQPTRLRFVLL